MTTYPDSRISWPMVTTLAICLSLSSCDKPSTPTAVPPANSSETTTSAATSGLSGVPVPVLSGNVPFVIPAHDTSLNPTQSRTFFDAFSWQSFVALNWPVVAGQPGSANQPNVPSVFQSAPNRTPVVWMSYKTVDDLFSTGSARPTAWSTGPNPQPTDAGVKPGSTHLSRLTKHSTRDQLSDTQEAFSFPLVDQNGAYARFEIRYNQSFYEFVRGNDQTPTSWLYLSKNLAAAEKPYISMPASASPSTAGALMVKAAWRIMTPADIKGNRYYMVEAQVEEVNDTIVPRMVGLVGLHIAQKLSGFPEWIWSSFEQVDNVQRGPGATPSTPISFNNGATTPVTSGGYANRPASQTPVDNPVPVQVSRLNPIPDTPAGASTRDVNKAWQQALAGTVWQNYELVITQWPSDPGTFATIDAGGSYPAQAGGAFPADGCTNTTMETYFQSPGDAKGAGGNSCMSCHYRAGLADFSWGLMRRAH